MTKYNVVKNHDNCIHKLEQVAETMQRIQQHSTEDDFHPMRDQSYEIADAIVQIMIAGNISIEYLELAIESAVKEGTWKQ